MSVVRAMSENVNERIRGRYAPSPTGDLHLGNLRTALLAWLFSRCLNGQFVLRVEDLDRPRTRGGATERMLADLHWLGLNWDEGPDCGGPYAPYTQSERTDIYQHYLHRLQERGQVYPCYCSRAEIARIASAPQQDDDALESTPRYPGTCRTLTNAQRRAHETRGRRPSLRFRVPDTRLVSFSDQIAGHITQQVQQTVGDFILYRSDGIFAYQFAVVVDDALMHINQVVRGADLLSSTPRQILLYEALGFPVPTFAHVPLLYNEQGKRLAKRDFSTGLVPLREAGMSSAHVLGQLAASCGLLTNNTAVTPNELVQSFQGTGYDIMRKKLVLSLRNMGYSAQ
jgi:glutamyl-tRNA synthetase